MRQRRPQRAVQEGPLEGLLDVMPGMVDQVLIVHARWAGRHAGETGQAAIKMLDDRRRRRAVVLQHVLDLVDAAAGAIQFIAKQDVCRAGRRAEAAMHAGSQNLLRFRHVRVLKLG